MRILFSICILILLVTGRCYGQDEQSPSPSSGRTSLGLGAGLDYGGAGVNLLIYPNQHVGLFAGVGYALAGVGSNVGVKIRTGTLTKMSPYAIGMYGYNAAVSVSNGHQYNRLFYGPSIGLGVDSRPRDSGGYWSFAVLLPFRTAEVDDYINSLKSNGVNFSNSLLPVTISIGYRIPIH